MKTRHVLLFLIATVFAGALAAQPAERLYKVLVAPDRTDWTYNPGDPVKFNISVFRDGNLVKNAKVYYEIGPEKLPATKKDSMVLTSGSISLEGGTMRNPGFLRCVATVSLDGQNYRGLGTAGFAPQNIAPAVELPQDFTAFWDQAKADLAKVPLDARLTLLPERCTETVDVYHVNLQNYRPGTRLYGILCVPKKEGKYPALLRVPGAGARPYQGDVGTAERGIITFEIGIHGVPVTMPVQTYNDMMASNLSGYWVYNLDDRDAYYYKRVYMGCVRANDFLVSLPKYDGTNLAVTGGSQGGALSIVTAALDPRVKWLGAFYPALSDLAGYMQNRAGGWPHMFDMNNQRHRTPEKLKTAAYYDVVSFARVLKTPGYYSWGFNDETCPPTSMYAAYNVIKAPKELLLALDTGHWTYPEQGIKMNNWLVAKLKGDR